ncbi:hypothetical protein QCM80_42595 [Bradyrhizobium sp. SSUT112]|nr:hypothetical protein [Bradyrhizobium sp. SSUT112]MDH2357224.1 hypothetical protein [Bradyrhizobium sp. SSUT112]
MFRTRRATWKMIWHDDQGACPLAKRFEKGRFISSA